MWLFETFIERDHGSLSITVYPYKLTQRELEARLEPGLSVLPGQYLRFEATEPVFAQVREVQALPSTEPGLPGGFRLTIALLYGTPSLQPQQVTLMTATQWANAIQRLQEPITEPLRLSADFSAEFSRLGPLTVIGGDDFVQKLDALHQVMTAIQAHRRVVILDPLGIFSPEDGLSCWVAGRDACLSLQVVGSRQFLEAFGELFAPSLRESALRVVADHLPPMHEFMGFQSLLDWYGALTVPLKNLILQNFQQVAQTRVFADTQAQSLDWHRAVQQSVTVLNLSGLTEPWRGLFYREALQALLQQAGDAVVPVLIYPEHYLPELAHWVEKADESEVKLLMLASPYVNDSVLQMANNRLWTDTPGAFSLQGALTLGLPLSCLSSASAAPKVSDDQSVASVVSEGQWPDLKPPVELAPGKAHAVQDKPFYSSFSVPLYDVDESFEADHEPWVSAPDAPALPLSFEPPTVNEDSSLPPREPEGVASREETLPFVSPVDVPEDALVAVDKGGSSSLAAPSEVVDLSAPSPQSAPEFLSTAQLSALLNTGPTKLFDPSEPLDEVPSETGILETPEPQATETHLSTFSSSVNAAALGAGVTAPAPTVLPSSDGVSFLQAASATPAGPVFYPTAAPSAATEEFDFPLPELDDRERSRASVVLEAPMIPEASAVAVPDATQSKWPEPAMTAKDVLTVPAASDLSSGMAFPSPDAYEKEEFFFELNPVSPLADSPLGYSSQQPEVPLSVSSLGPSTVAQSLASFASLDLPQAEPFPEPASHSVSTSSASMPLAAVPLATSSTTTDLDMQEALDAIFPYKFEARPPEEVSAPAVNAPPPVPSEPMVIMPKAVEAPSVDDSGFHAGDRVTHPSYGAGVVQKVIPMEGSVVLNILFDGVGKRLLDPALCELSLAALVN